MDKRIDNHTRPESDENAVIVLGVASAETQGMLPPPVEGIGEEPFGGISPD